MPPIWINEDGKRAQTRLCPRPGCGREVPIRRYRYDTLRMVGWSLYPVASLRVGVTTVAWLEADDYLSLVPGRNEHMRRGSQNT